MVKYIRESADPWQKNKTQLGAHFNESKFIWLIYIYMCVLAAADDISGKKL